jgi:hypothetical protein
LGPSFGLPFEHLFEIGFIVMTPLTLDCPYPNFIASTKNLVLKKLTFTGNWGKEYNINFVKIQFNTKWYVFDNSAAINMGVQVPLE